MKVERLSLQSFRGIKRLELDFTERVTAFVGVNRWANRRCWTPRPLRCLNSPGGSTATLRVAAHRPGRHSPGDEFARIELTVGLRGNR